jgi:plastocyanin
MFNRRLLALAALALVLSLALALAGCSGTSNQASPAAGTSVAKPPASAGSSSTAGSSTAGSATAGSSSVAEPAAHAVVVISDTAFTPATITIKPGQQVFWENEGKVAHNVTFDDGSVSSPDITSGSSAAHKFAKAGTFKYHDSRQPQMTGTVVVK